MTAMQFKKGDRVIGNEKNPTYNGRFGIVAYVNGEQYWVRFDDTGKSEGGLHGFWLEPFAVDIKKAA